MVEELRVFIAWKKKYQYNTCILPELLYFVLNIVKIFPLLFSGESELHEFGITTNLLSLPNRLINQRKGWKGLFLQWGGGKCF